MKVFVYFNLHKKCLSVKALEGANRGRVIAHADSVSLTGCEFKVSEAGRQRVLRERRKNVHAGVVGTLLEVGVGQSQKDIAAWLYVPVKYNPYKFKTFVKAVGEEPVKYAKRTIITTDNGRAAIYANEFFGA